MKVRLNFMVDSDIIDQIEEERKHCKISKTAMFTLLFIEALEARKRKNSGLEQK